jgi:hypothetical protein
MNDIPRETTVVETIFTIKLNHQTLLQVGGTLTHDLGIRILENVITADLNMALSRHNPQSRLRAEVDQLATEVTLVLRNTLIKRRRQTGIIPSGCLGIVVHKVHPSSVGETHFPAAGQRSELRNGLLLDRGVVSALVLVLAVHADVLLSARVNPGRGSRIMINKVCSSFRGMPLFPSWRKLSGARGGRSCSHHGNRVGMRARSAGGTSSGRGSGGDGGTRWRRGRLLAIRRVGGVGAGTVFR